MHSCQLHRQCIAHAVITRIMVTKLCKLLIKCALAIPIIVLVDLFGLWTHIYELDFATHYHYPLKNDSRPQLNYRFLQVPGFSAEQDDSNPTRLTILIKSAIKNTQRRQAIRKTWGYESRFSDVHIRRAFMLGVSGIDDDIFAIDAEAKHHGDIIQADFLDTYYNNTIKTMMGLRWAYEHYNKSDYYIFLDDDYYVSIKNVLRFIGRGHQTHQQRDLFAGFVYNTSPLRQKFSKWYVSLAEYPFDMWPPYVTAGGYILARQTLHKLYTLGRSLPLFRFDDIFLGIVALKANIHLQHCQGFYVKRPTYKGPDSYSEVIAAHGFDDPDEMERIWNECRSANYA